MRHMLGKAISLGVCFFLAVVPLAYASKTKEATSSAITPGTVGDYIAANFATGNYNVEEAAELFSRTLKANPHNPLVMENTFKAMLFAGRMEEAFTIARNYLAYDGSSLSATLLLAVQAIQKGQYQQVEKMLAPFSAGQKETLANIDDLVVRFMVVWAKVGLGKYDEALGELDRIALSRDNFLVGQKALVHDLAGNRDKAQQLYLQSAAGRPDHRRLVKLAGNFLERHGAGAKAETLYTSYQRHYNEDYFLAERAGIKKKEIPLRIVLSPKEAMVEVLLETAKGLYQEGLREETLAYIKILLFLNPYMPDAEMLLAQYYESVGQHKEAITWFSKIKKEEDFFLEARVNIAKNWYKLGRVNKTRKEFIDIIKEKPRNVFAPLVFADLLRQDGEYQEAAHFYGVGIERLPGVLPQYWSIFFARGICYEQAGNWEAAEKSLRKALDLFPKQPEVMNYLGYSWLERNIYPEEAKKMIEGAHALQPTDPHIMDSVGWMWFKRKAYDKSVAYLERAAEVIPFDPVINDHLGDIYWSQGRKLEAQYQWKRALEYGPGTVDAGKLRKKIEEGLAHE